MLHFNLIVKAWLHSKEVENTSFEKNFVSGLHLSDCNFSEIKRFGLISFFTVIKEPVFVIIVAMETRKTLFSSYHRNDY